MDWLFNWSNWLILGFVLLALELIIPGVLIMWWGFSAILLAILVWLLPDLSVSIQISGFAILAIVFSLIWWKYQHAKDKQDDKSTSLNSREQSMIGMQGIIVEILENGVARGKFGDTTWRVMGTGLNLGDKVQVQRVDGITLYVTKMVE
ncbi:Nodulation efficiency protein D [Mannheimia varigena USDA-ARS-USMARC-1296]|uniref:Nodulation efficiency protein D n=1 Tax=Mannheimia varigena USDA-ARS-USMARC-1296 TaxID=1433287 RepID=W0QAJ7_9PAST|nr:NfeD family protein [Mannheimia varigena]AHG75307.1 Nodulation efficiency protein D [Mannheimia varigena USDA-ARS-USMARC-1296]